MSFAVGSLVRAREREWVVLPQSTDQVVMVRPVGGTEDETTGILTALETVEPATFAWPTPEDLGDARSARLLRDALRLGFRASAGPLRCAGRLGVMPRPYQLVPLLMALRLDPVRLLIADDVGVGKTIEAALVAKELLEDGHADGLAVLCPPHLAEQWAEELATKFSIEAELVLASTAARLERGLLAGQTIFDRFPHVVVSTDFIKSDRRRDEFLRTCPDLVVVDEAHTCAADPARGARHQRHQLVAGLAARPDRHLVLVTATPHSGNEGAFASLVGLLDPDLAGLVRDLGDGGGADAARQAAGGPGRAGEMGLGGAGRADARSRLARHLVQRRRGDLATYLGDTPFPQRDDAEVTYRLAPDYRGLADRALAYARESVADPSGGHRRQRVRWWSALALLRALASSPRAAAATLRARAESAGTASVAEADAQGAQAVLDLADDEATGVLDVSPGADPTEDGDDDGEEDGEARLHGGDADPAGSRAGAGTLPAGAGTPPAGAGTLAAGNPRRRLLAMAGAAEALEGAPDAKLALGLGVVSQLVGEGASPVVFCRFIDTAEYLAEHLRAHLGAGVAVAAVTGRLPAAEREARVAELARAAPRVLVATDCLSEGINLQASFDAVVHYDLAWNPTRHEQRDGRVDRYGQASPTVRSVTLYGTDNQIDRVVLEVLLRKQRAIRHRLGIFVPVPGGTEAVVEALFEALLGARERGEQIELDLGEVLAPHQARLDLAWERAADREQASRTRFAQASVKVDEVAAELAQVGSAIGAEADVARFVSAAVGAYGGRVVGDGTRPGAPPARIVLAGTPPAVADLADLARPALGRTPLGRPASAGAPGPGSRAAPAPGPRAGSASELVARYALPVARGETYLPRTHPFVEGLAAQVLGGALDALGGSPARRAGVMRTAAVTRRSTLMVLRLRFDLVHRAVRENGQRALLAEDAAVVAFAGAPTQAEWLPDEEAEALLGAAPEANVDPEQARWFLSQVTSAAPALAPALDAIAARRAQAVLDAHRRVRAAAGVRGWRTTIAHQPPDVLGAYVLLPAGA